MEKNKTYDEVRKKNIPRSKDPHSVDNPKMQMITHQMYLSNIYYVICDALISNLSQHKVPYRKTANKFACFLNLKSLSTLQKESAFLQKCYPLDLEDGYSDELEQFLSQYKMIIP